MIHYATLQQVRTYLKPGVTDMSESTDNLLRTLIVQSVRTIDEYTNRHFEPTLATRKFDYPVERRHGLGIYDARQWWARNRAVSTFADRVLKVDEDLLAVTTLTNGDDDEFEADDFVLEPANETPKHSIRLKQSSDSFWERDDDGNRAQVIDVLGTWGYHRRWSDAFVDTGDSVQNDPLAAGGTTLTVSDVRGDAGDQEPNRIQPGNMLRLEDEYVYVSATNGRTSATIVRAYNGTTAAEHDQDTTIYVFRPDWRIVLATEFLVKQFYRAKDADEQSAQQILGTNIIIKPESLPAYVKTLLPQPRVRGRTRRL